MVATTKLAAGAKRQAMEAANLAQNGKYRIYTPRVINAGSKVRFFRDRTAALIGHAGGEPSRTQLVLIARICRLEWDAFVLDRRQDAGELSAHDMRMRLALENRLRLDLQMLGMKAAAKPKGPTLGDIIAEHHGDAGSP